MNIICPQCGFSRPFPPDRAPAHSVIATCPQCSCRFRFHPQDGSSEQLSPVRNEAAPAASDLPPGAIIPGFPGAGIFCSLVFRRPDSQSSGVFCLSIFFCLKERKAPVIFYIQFFRFFRIIINFLPLIQIGAAEIPGLPSGNPWDVAPAPSGWMVAFYRTATRIMFGAPAFFSCLRPHRRSLRALSFYLIVSVILSVVQLLWMRGMTSMLVDGGMDPQMQQMMASTLAIHESMPLFVLKQVAFVTLQLYVQSALLYLMYRLILRDKPEFDLIFQVSAYGSAPMLLCVIPVLGALTGLVWSLACTLVGYKTVLRLDWSQTLLGYAPVFLLEMFLLLQVMQML